MQSWRGRGRQASRDALVRLATAWKAGPDSAGPAGTACPAWPRPGARCWSRPWPWPSSTRWWGCRSSPWSPGQCPSCDGEIQPAAAR